MRHLIMLAAPIGKCNSIIGKQFTERERERERKRDS